MRILIIMKATTAESLPAPHIDTIAFARTRETYDHANGEGAFEALSLASKLEACKVGADMASDLGLEDVGVASTERPSLIWSLAPGLHVDVPAEEYHRRVLGLVNKGSLDQIHKSGATYKAWVDGLIRSEESPALAFGSALHCAVLEPYVFASTYAIVPDFGDGRTKEAKAKRAAWEEEHKDHIALSAEDAATIVKMTAALRAHPKAARLLEPGKGIREATIRWDDEETGLACKGRLDIVRRDIRTVVDLKSTVDASPEAFSRSCGKYRYEVQQEHYSAGMAAIGEPVDAFVFIAVEKTPPYLVGVYVLGPESEAAGRRKYRADMSRMKECLDAGVFPGLSDDVEEIELPRWAL